MILTETKPFVESSNDFDEKFFSIADLGLVFDILRNKLYSNSILAICREYSCNARDTLREVGKFNEPIEIHLPSNLEPHYDITDAGQGISPDRVETVFIKYTASTKRNDNIQLGAYGIGSKCAMAYADSFSVTTVFDGVKYSYSCYVDSTKVGKMALLSKIPTDAHNGTTISIPVKPADFYSFRQFTEQACRHWPVKPRITGGKDIEWQTQEHLIEGKNWAIVPSKDYYDRSAKLIIDGIEYPLDIDSLRKYADPAILDAAKGDFQLQFGIGELSLSANREQIYLDKPTQERIKERFVEIQKDIKDIVDNKLASFTSLWDANVYFRKDLTRAFNDLSFLGNLKWDGLPLTHGRLRVECPAFLFEKGEHYNRRTGARDVKICRTAIHTLEFPEHAALYVDDLKIPDITNKHVQKAFDDDSKLKFVYIVCPSEFTTEADLNKDINLDKLLPKYLSTITKASLVRASMPASARLIIFKFDNGAFHQVSYDNMESDTNKKVICRFRKDNYAKIRTALFADGRQISSNDLRALLNRNVGYSIYGIDENKDSARIKKEFSDFQEIDAFVKEKFTDNAAIDCLEIKFAKQHSYDIQNSEIDDTDNIGKLILDKSSVFFKRAKLHKRLLELYRSDNGLLHLYESLNGYITTKTMDEFAKNHPELDVVMVNKEYSDKYPLLEHIRPYKCSELIESIAQYINMMDKNQGNKEIEHE